MTRTGQEPIDDLRGEFLGVARYLRRSEVQYYAEPTGFAITTGPWWDLPGHNVTLSLTREGWWHVGEGRVCRPVTKAELIRAVNAKIEGIQGGEA